MDNKQRLQKFEAYNAARDLLVEAGMDAPKCPEKEILNELVVKETQDGAVIGIRGVIGQSVDAKLVSEAIADIQADKIIVEIDSVGGSLFAGRAIANALRKHPAEVTTIVEGMAASIAAVIFMAGDKRIVMEGAEVMIHRSHAAAILSGNEEELRDQIVEIDKLVGRLSRYDRGIAETIASASKLDYDQVMDALRAETWYGESEAISAGLATGGDPVNAKKKKQVVQMKKADAAPDPEVKRKKDKEIVARDESPEPESDPATPAAAVREIDVEYVDDYFPLDRLRTSDKEVLDIDALVGPGMPQ